MNDPNYSQVGWGRFFCPPFSATAFVPPGQESAAHPTCLALKIKGTADQLWLFDYFAANTVNGSVVSDHKLDRVEFANGVVWDQAMIQTVAKKAMTAGATR